MLRVVIALAAVVVILRVGIGILRGLAQQIPEPPPPGELRKVSIRYRCSICGAELKMLLAADQEPEPPRHCQEDMVLVAPLDE